MPKYLKILTEGDKFLRQVMKPVPDPKAAHLPALVEDMVHTMRKAKGIGLAAIQIGVDARIFVLETVDGPLTFINPEIIERSAVDKLVEEGCLSVPGFFSKVKRSKTVTCRAWDLAGEEQIYDAQGLFAQAIQHEIDHLNGHLFIDLIENFDKSQL